MARWAIELSEFDIQFKPRLALKGQVLADFLAEIPQQEMELDGSDWWTLNVDGASLQMGAGLGLQLKAPTGEVIEQAIRINFSVSNNEAEYEAIIVGLDLAISVSLEKIYIQSDSQLVVGQICETPKNPNFREMLNSNFGKKSKIFSRSRMKKQTSTLKSSHKI